MDVKQLQPTTDAIAAQHGFGDSVWVIDAYAKEESTGRLGCAAVPLVLAVVLVVVGLLIGGFWGIVLPVVAAVPGLAFVVMLIQELINLSRAGKHGGVLYRNGFVQVRHGEVAEVIDLRQSQVTEKVVQHYKNGFKNGPPEVTFTITGPHGSTKLKGSEGFRANALPQIKQVAAEARLPLITEQMARGEEVSFDKIALTATSFRVNNAEMIPYTEITSLSTENGTWTVQYGSVNQRTHSQLIGETPDFVILSSLLSTWSGKQWT